MADSDKTVSYGIDANPDGFVGAMDKAHKAAKQAGAGIEQSWAQVGEAFKNVMGPVGKIIGLLAGGAAFKEAIGATNKLNAEVMSLSKTMGISGTEASALNTALGRIGTDSETYTGAFQKFAKQLKNNEDGLQSMGLKTRDANGNLRDSNTLFTEALQTVGEYKPGLDKTTAAMTLFGKGAEDVMRLQKLNNKVLDEARQKNKDLGLTITQEGIDASRKYGLAVNDMSNVWLALKNVVGQAVMPIFTRLAEWFSAIGPTAVFVFKVAINSVVTAFQAVILVVKSVWTVLKALADPLFTFGGALRKLISGDLKGATADMMGMGASWGKAMSGVFDQIKEDGTRTWTEVKNLWGTGTEVAAPTNGAKRMGDFKDTKEVKDTSRTAQWEAELEERKFSLQEQARAEGRFAEMSKAEERQFWQDKLALTAAGTTEQIGVRKKVATVGLEIMRADFATEVAILHAQAEAYKHNTDAKLAVLEQEAALVAQRFGKQSKEYEAVQAKIVAVAREASHQRLQIEEITQARMRNIATAQVDADRLALQLQLDLQLISQKDFIAAQQGLEDRLFAIKATALQAKLALLEADTDRNPVAIAQTNAEIEALATQHAQRLTEIRNRATVESARFATGLMNSLQGGLEQVFNQLGRKIKTVGDLMRSMVQVVMSALQSMLAKWASEQIMAYLRTKIAGTATALGQIQAQAAVAGAGGTASMAAAPWPLNLGAPAFGAAMAGLSAGYAAALTVPSAAGGWEVPRDTLAMVHEKEMILPASIAQPLKQQLAEGGNASGGGGATVNISAHPMPGNYFMIHRDQLIKAIQSARRDFAFN